MIQNRNIICIASSWWYDPTSKHHLMKLLAGHNHVIWVNYHGSRRPGLTTADVRGALSKLRQFVQGPRRVDENITVVTPMLVPLPGNPAVAGINRRLLVRQIRAVLRTLPERPVQFWSFAPDVDWLCGQFDEECIVYYCVDEFSAFSGYDREAILAAEARLAARADLVVTTSKALYEAKRGLNPNTALVTHGVDYEHFASSERASNFSRSTTDRVPRTDGVPLAAFPPVRSSVEPPANLEALPKPVLGFWGLLQDWLEVDLLAEVASARPGWSIVLIGEAATDLSALRSRPNVHLLGRRPYAALPAYAAAFDVGIIPFRVNELTRAVNPIKLREYLAAGLPVVSTPLPEVEQYSQFVRVASNAAEFVAACDEAIAEDSPIHVAQRREAMCGEGWEAKVQEVSVLVQQCITRERRRSSLTSPPAPLPPPWPRRSPR